VAQRDDRDSGASAELGRKLQLCKSQSLAVTGDVDLLGDGGLREVLEALGAGRDDAASLFVVSNARRLETLATLIVSSAVAGRLTWVAYPKAGRLGTDLNRDVLAAFLSERGARPVRQIALDATWSALRFRPQ
jgi:hypothetical protein